jgi:WD40 repeat protein
MKMDRPVLVLLLLTTGALVYLGVLRPAMRRSFDRNDDPLFAEALSRPASRYEGHTNSVTCLAFSPDGRILASSSSDKTIRLWNVASAKVIRILRSPQNSIEYLAFSPDGAQLASAGSFDGRIYLWDISTGAKLRELQGGLVTALAYRVGGAELLSANDEHEIKTWDSTTGELLSHWAVNGRVKAFAFSPKRELLAATEINDMLVFSEMATGEEIAIVPLDCALPPVALSPDNTLIAWPSGVWGESISVWDMSKRKLVANWIAHKGFIPSVAFSPDSNTIASASYDNTVSVWEAATGKEICHFAGHRSPARCLAFSPDGKVLATAGQDTNVLIWSVPGK